MLRRGCAGYTDGMAVATRVSLSDFLAMEETKPYRELIDGEVVEKSMPTQSHSDVVLALSHSLMNHLRGAGLGKLFTELRCWYGPEDRVYLPDLCLFRANNLPPPGQNPVEVVPDFVIEVLSPDDRATRVIEKVQFYLRAGVPLLWVVDPERETVTVYRPQEAPAEAALPSKLAAAPVLPGFEVDLGALFASAR